MNNRYVPDPRLARLLQPLTVASLECNGTLDLTIELAKARAATATLAAAVELIALSDRDAITTSIALSAIELALGMMN